jgi:hypothetical protein
MICIVLASWAQKKEHGGTAGGMKGWATTPPLPRSESRPKLALMGTCYCNARTKAIPSATPRQGDAERPWTWAGDLGNPPRPVYLVRKSGR